MQAPLNKFVEKMMTEEQAELGCLLLDLDWVRTNENRPIVDAIIYLLRLRERELRAQEKAPDREDRG